MRTLGNLCMQSYVAWIGMYVCVCVECAVGKSLLPCVVCFGIFSLKIV